MIKIYGMDTCPDCTYVEAQVKGNDRYEIIDIGQHVKNLKAFLKLRDHSPAFDEAKRIGAAGRTFDVVRIDHFRGISSYWSIPAGNRTARCGGHPLLRAGRRHRDPLPGRCGPAFTPH